VRRHVLTTVVAAACLAQAAATAALTVQVGDRRDLPLLQSVHAVWKRAAQDLEGLSLSVPPATLIAHRDAATFARSTGRPWNTAAVTVGNTIHTQRLSALHSLGTLERTLRHEAFHLAHPRGLPTWLAEGLARHFSGEALADPHGPTGLENADAATLERTLRGSVPSLRAYREATRRAERLLRERGWKAALAVR
jgi:hypothetical protein